MFEYLMSEKHILYWVQYNQCGKKQCDAYVKIYKHNIHIY